MHQLEEEVGLAEPFVGPVAQHGGDLGAHVQRGAALAERMDVRDRRQVLRERPVLRLALTLARLGTLRLADVPRDDDGPGLLAGAVRDRGDRQGDREVVPVLVAVCEAGDVDPLPRLRGLCGAHRGLARGLRSQQGDRLAGRLGRLVPVDRLRAGVPAHDRPLEVDADDRLGGRVPHGGELAGDDALLQGGAAPGHRQPAGEAADRQPGREPGQREPGLVGDEEEVQQPPRGGDGEPAPDAAHGAGQRGDDEPGGDGKPRIAVVPVSEQQHQRLEHDAEGDGDEAANACRRADGSPLQSGQVRHGRKFGPGGPVSFPRLPGIPVRIRLS